MAGKKLSIDMSRGPLFGKIIRYALPLMLAYLLQLAFHAADMVVIGRWGSPASLAAIGATVSITGLIINAGGGSVQTADIIVEAGKDVWVVVDATGTANFYYEEPTDLSGGEKPTEPTAPQPTEPAQKEEEPKRDISGPVAALISFAVVVVIGIGVLMILRSKKLAAQKEEPAAEEAAEEEAASQE